MPFHSYHSSRSTGIKSRQHVLSCPIRPPFRVCFPPFRFVPSAQYSDELRTILTPVKAASPLITQTGPHSNHTLLERLRSRCREKGAATDAFQTWHHLGSSTFAPPKLAPILTSFFNTALGFSRQSLSFTFLTPPFLCWTPGTLPGAIFPHPRLFPSHDSSLNLPTKFWASFSARNSTAPPLTIRLPAGLSLDYSP